MDTTAISSKSLTIRRSSCPSVNVEDALIPKMQKENTAFKAKDARKSKNAEFAFHDNNILFPTSRTIRTNSLTNGVVMTQIRKLQPSNFLIPVDHTFPLRAAKSVSSINNGSSGSSGVTLDMLSNFDKNEAEIIGDFPVNQRRGSLPNVLGKERLSAEFAVSGAAFIKSHIQRHGNFRGHLTDCVDRELQSLYRNSVEEKRLQQTFNKLEKQSYASTLVFRHKINKVFSEYKKIIHISPTTDEWLSMKKCHRTTRYGQERKAKVEAISGSIHQARPLICLQDSKPLPPWRSTSEKSLVPDSASDSCIRVEIKEIPNMARRHTITGGNLKDTLSRFNKSHTTTKCPQNTGRRRTLADINVIREL